MAYDLYVVTDEEMSGGITHVKIAELSLAGGADCIQLRDKKMTSDELLSVAEEISVISKRHGSLFFVNDSLDVAVDSGADGVHLGQDDMPLSDARGMAPRGFLIGVSVGNLGEARTAERDGADYIALSPTFDTNSKSDAGPGNGIFELKRICENVSVPVIGIGGIGLHNVRDVINAGASGCAVISAVVCKEDITAAAAEIKKAISEAKKELKPIF